MSSITTHLYTYPLLHFNRAADLVYGLFCVMCFTIGTTGNIASFFYFLSKKKDVPSTVYMMVTITDTVISMLILPVGISFLSNRDPGLIFHYKIPCAGWTFLWGITVRLSTFFVLCLCVTRTYSLIRPFSQQKILYLLMVVLIYVLLQVAQWVGLTLLGAYYGFSPAYASCSMFLSESANISAISLFLDITTIITFILPLFVVIVSCVITTVILHKTPEIAGQPEVQQKSRNRATITILLFALLYLVCNTPLVIRIIVATHSSFSKSRLIYEFFKFDKQLYFENAITTLLLAVNSAINPLFYLWRMPSVGQYIMSRIRGVVRRGGEERRAHSTVTCAGRGTVYSYGERSYVSHPGRNSIVPTPNKY